jgi:hypothetical protein
MATRDDVEDFLREVSAAIALGHRSFKSREKNSQKLTALGLTLNQAWEVIQRLTPDNYSSGPRRDDTDSEQRVWVFGYKQEGVEVYIKLRLAQDPKRRSVKNLFVWSFHRAEYPIKYPLRGGKS